MACVDLIAIADIDFTDSSASLGGDVFDIRRDNGTGGGNGVNKGAALDLGSLDNRLVGVVGQFSVKEVGSESENNYDDDNTPAAANEFSGIVKKFGFHVR